MRYDFSQSGIVDPEPTDIGPYTIDWGKNFPDDDVTLAEFTLFLDGVESTDATIHSISYTGSIVSFWILNVTPQIGGSYTLRNHVNLASGVVDYEDASLTFT